MSKSKTRPTLSADELFDQMRQVQDSEGDGDNQIKPKPSNHIIMRHSPHEWLDNYIQYSKILAPRAFDLLHEACGIWVLSSVAGGRAELFFGGARRSTAMMMTVIASSSRWSKSHTIRLATNLLEHGGFESRSLPTRSTPQAIIQDMADNPKIVAILKSLETEDLTEEREVQLNHELELLRWDLGDLYANEGQRWWHISEFGTKIIEAMRPSSPMALYSDFFRDINEKKVYTNKTRTHGYEKINNPYLSVIGDTTPSDLAKYTRPHSPLWSNGFFPRFSIITMSDEELRIREKNERSGKFKARVPYNYVEDEPPIELTSSLNDMDGQLGRRMSYQDDFLKKRMLFSEEVWEGFYLYENHVDKHRLLTEDLDGSYTRLSVEQCVAVSMLLAMIDGSIEIQPRHLHRAQEFCVRVRISTEAFYKRMTDNTVNEKAVRQNQLEEKIVGIISRFHKRLNEWPTQREIRNRTGRSSSTRLPNEEITNILSVLKMAHVVKDVKFEGRRVPCWVLL